MCLLCLIRLIFFNFYFSVWPLYNYSITQNQNNSATNYLLFTHNACIKYNLKNS